MWLGVALFGLKLVTMCVGTGASEEGLWCRPRSAAACVQPGATWYELQSDLQMVATCAELGDA